MNLFYKNKGNETSNPNSVHKSQQIQFASQKNSPNLSSNLQTNLKKINYKDEEIVPGKSLIDQIFENANEIFENEISNFSKKIEYGDNKDEKETECKLYSFFYSKFTLIFKKKFS